MPTKKTPAQVAAEKKVAVERAKIAAQKKAAAKPKMAMTKTYTSTKPSTGGTKTVTGKSVTVKAPAMKTVTGQSVTVTGKKPAAKKTEDKNFYLVRRGGQNYETDLAGYTAHKGPKAQMQKDASGYPIMPGSGGKRYTEKYNRKKP